MFSDTNDIFSAEDIEDIELTTYATIQNNNDTKSYFYDKSSSSDSNTAQPDLTSSTNLLSAQTSSESLSNSDPNPLNFTSIVSSNKTLNHSLETGEKRRTNANPSVDDIISGILQLIGGNVKLPRPQLGKLPPMGSFRPDPALLSNTRINNRGPPKSPFINPVGPPLPNGVPPNVLIGPGRPAGIALPMPPSHLARLPIPLNIVPTKTPFMIPESDVSFLLGLIKPHIKDEKEFISLKNLPKLQTSLIIDKTRDKSNIDSVINTRPFFTEKILANPSKIQEFIRSNSYYSNIFSSLSSHLAEVNASKIHFSINSSLNESENHSTLKKGQNNTQSIISSFIIPNQTESPVPSGPVTDWVPLLVPSNVANHEVFPSDEPIIITMPEQPSVFEMIVKQQIGPKPTQTSSQAIDPTPVTTNNLNTTTIPTKTQTIEKTSLFMESMSASIDKNNETKADAEIVYGRPAQVSSNDQKGIAPSFTTSTEEIITLLGIGRNVDQ